MKALEVNYCLRLIDGPESRFSGYPLCFIQLGAGGTGSQLAPFLGKMLAPLKSVVGGALTNKHTYTIIDGDAVEDKNVGRQNFTVKDIGQNKAARMAAKVGATFGMRVDCVDQYIESEEHLTAIITSYVEKYKAIPVVINCTDTHAVRRMIHKVVRNWKVGTTPLLYIDSGNEEYAGQVVIGLQGLDKGQVILYSDTVTEVAKLTPFDNPAGYFPLPTVVELYPDILDSKEKFTTELSCAERAISNPQAGDTNLMAAVIIKNMISNLMSNTGLTYNHVTFNTKLGNMTTHYINASAITLAGGDLTKAIIPGALKRKSYSVSHEAEAETAAEVMARGIPIDDVIIRGEAAADVPGRPVQFHHDHGEVIPLFDAFQFHHDHGEVNPFLGALYETVNNGITNQGIGITGRHDLPRMTYDPYPGDRDDIVVARALRYDDVSDEGNNGGE